jgi:hypothetical protein
MQATLAGMAGAAMAETPAMESLDTLARKKGLRFGSALGDAVDALDPCGASCRHAVEARTSNALASGPLTSPTSAHRA